MTDGPIILEINQRVAKITLNDPAHRNALSEAMFDGLEAALTEIEATPSVSVLLINGEGRVFCSGFDLGAAVENPSVMGDFIRRLGSALIRIRSLPAVCVAAVQGAAIAGGCALACSADLVVTHTEARFGYPVLRLGISPAVSLPLLQNKVGPGLARSMMLGGKVIDGSEATRSGLASHLVDNPDDVAAKAETLVQQLAQKPANALVTTKQWLNEIDGSSYDEALLAIVADTGPLATEPEAIEMMRTIWNRRKA